MSNRYRPLLRPARRTYRKQLRSPKKSADDLFIYVGFALIFGVVWLGWRIVFDHQTLFTAIAIVIFIFMVWRHWATKHQQRAKIRALQISHIDTMDGLTFEHYVGKLLQSQGFKTQITRAHGDYGVDVIAVKGKLRCAVQCKRYRGSVSRTAISDAVAGASYYRCNASMVVTNAYFTKGAKVLAQANRCQLIDRDALVAWIITWQKR